MPSRYDESIAGTPHHQRGHGPLEIIFSEIPLVVHNQVEPFSTGREHEVLKWHWSYRTRHNTHSDMDMDMTDVSELVHNSASPSIPTNR